MPSFWNTAKAPSDARHAQARRPCYYPSLNRGPAYLLLPRSSPLETIALRSVPWMRNYAIHKRCLVSLPSMGNWLVGWRCLRSDMILRSVKGKGYFAVNIPSCSKRILNVSWKLRDWNEKVDIKIRKWWTTRKTKEFLLTECAQRQVTRCSCNFFTIVDFDNAFVHVACKV